MGKLVIREEYMHELMQVEFTLLDTLLTLRVVSHQTILAYGISLPCSYGYIESPLDNPKTIFGSTDQPSCCYSTLRTTLGEITLTYLGSWVVWIRAWLSLLS